MRDPREMTSLQRREEIAEILAHGLLRVETRKTIKKSRLLNNSLDSGEEESVYAPQP